MRKFIYISATLIALLSCAKEKVAPEQMISGDYALDDGRQVSGNYLHFEDGNIIEMVTSSEMTFAENFFWNCRRSDFQSEKSSKYSIQNGELYAFGRNMGSISQKDDVLTIDGKTYSVLNGFKAECYSKIAIDKQTLNFLPQTISAEVTIENPIKAGVLTASTKTNWISDVKVVDNKTLSYTVSGTNVERQGRITLTYTNALPYDVTVSQEPSTHILLPSASGSVSYASQTASFEYSIDNPVPSSSLEASCNADWISNIQVTDNIVSFDVAENASASTRNASFTLKYAGAGDVTYTLKQNYWISTSITTTPEAEEHTYSGSNGSFTFSIDNPRDGASVTATTANSWITEVRVSDSTVSYKVAENLSAQSRNGKISLKYGKSSTIFATKDFAVNQNGMPVTAISLNKTNIALVAGETETLIASTTPSDSDAELKWTSNHPEYADVDANGKITAIDAGTATITVSAGDKTASCIVTVSGKEKKLALITSWTESTGLTYGNIGTIIISNPSGGTLSISSQPSSSVATASLSGSKVTITPVSSGETSITIKSAKTTGYAEATKTVTIKVLKATPTMTLSATRLSIEPGGNTTTLSITTNSDGALSTSSSSTSVATVSVSGKTVTVKSKDIEGSATITVTCAETGKYKQISKTATVVIEEQTMIDLGLSVKWAKCNLGASKPEEYGGYYQWAGTKDVTDKSIYLDWSNCPYHTGSSSSTGWTKYNTKSSYGTVDNKTVLDPADDVAHIKLGGKWRMPTYDEWAELKNTSNCSWTWTSINGIKGYKVQSKKTGYTDRWIFLPAAGYRSGDSLDIVGSDGYYWSSSLYTYSPYSAYYLNFYSGNVYTSYDGRYSGLSVRPVCDK